MQDVRVVSKYQDDLSLTVTSSDDMHKRYSVFYLIGCVASAFSGILAYGLSHMVRTIWITLAV